MEGKNMCYSQSSSVPNYETKQQELCEFVEVVADDLLKKRSLIRDAYTESELKSLEFKIEQLREYIDFNFKMPG